MSRNQPLDDGLLAAVDMGSNSFHLAVARLDHGVIRLTDSLSEKVQLAAGLDENQQLSDEAIDRALACLSRFSQHLAGVEPQRLRIVGTNALRVARNARRFVKAAQEVLNHPIEIIAGREEARLIYVGVSQTLAGQGKRLVIDIGGGSTEFIIGERHEPLLTESLHMGCVSYSQRFFPDGAISAKALDRAITSAQQELASIARAYRDLGWDSAVGSSGTMKAVRNVISSLGWATPEGHIPADAIPKLRELLLSVSDIRELELPGLKEDRRLLMPAGFAIVSAIFASLHIDTLAFSDGALREGVLYDMLGRFGDGDIRDRSIESLQQRYGIDREFSERVCNTAGELFQQLQSSLNFTDDDLGTLLRAAKLHEIGKAISHTGYHKHGAYLLFHADLAGFSKPEQEALSLMVGSHRRRLRSENMDALLAAGGEALLQLSLILRLAVLLNHSRSRDDIAIPELRSDGQHYRIDFTKSWLKAHPLTLADLEQESNYFQGVGLKLSAH
ncbi:MAG: exopolyphosphatase [Paraperlucidibaca sp.]